MKANQKTRFTSDNQGYVQVIAGIVALLIAIIIGVMVYFEVTDSVSEFGEVAETFTGYSATDNASAWNVNLLNSPVNTNNCNVTCYNSTGTSESYPTFTLNLRTVSVAADAADEFSQVNVTYTSNIANTEAGATSMASTVFGLLPLIALVVIAAIILGVVLAFGKGGKGGGL